MTRQEKYRRIDADLILEAYRIGYFPMAEPDTQEIVWYSPDPRAILPLDKFKISRSLRQKVRQRIYQVQMDTAFERVVRSCAHREETWISSEIIAAYTELHRRGFAHSIESWFGGQLAGGLYGVAIGGAFFGESMFSVMTDSSKVALVHLVELLHEKRFILLDTQFVNDHLRQFGVVEIPRSQYLEILSTAVSLDLQFSEV